MDVSYKDVVVSSLTELTFEQKHLKNELINFEEHLVC